MVVGAPAVASATCGPLTPALVPRAEGADARLGASATTPLLAPEALFAAAAAAAAAAATRTSCTEPPQGLASSDPARPVLCASAPVHLLASASAPSPTLLTASLPSSSSRAAASALAPTIQCADPSSGSRALGKRPAPGAHQRPSFQASLSGWPAADVDLASLAGKGAGYARSCAGPYAYALLAMPPPPIASGAKRAALGLADVPLLQSEKRDVAAERAARALVAILPGEAAAFILWPSSLEQLAARDPRAVAEACVDSLSGYGVSSLEKAASALGSFLSWVRVHCPDATVATGIEGAAFFKARPPSVSMLEGMNWLRDHCGLQMPARAPLAKPFRKGGRRAAAVVDGEKRSLSVAALLHFEYLAAFHPHPQVAGQAAMWYAMMLGALRAEQSRGLVINAVVPHGNALIACASAVRDKNPNPAAMQSRPVWFDIAGILYPGKVRSRLAASLEQHPGACALLMDTDSPDGDPQRATSFVAAPLSMEPRVCASLRGLLQLAPLSLSAEAATTYGGHSAKRFLLNFAEASPSFNSVESNDLGRFARSTAQSADLTPTEAMLQQHDLRCSALPDIYARKAKVGKAFDLIARASAELRSWALLSQVGQVSLPPEDGWGMFSTLPPPVAAAAAPPLDAGRTLPPHGPPLAALSGASTPAGAVVTSVTVAAWPSPPLSLEHAVG